MKGRLTMQHSRTSMKADEWRRLRSYLSPYTVYSCCLLSSFRYGEFHLASRSWRWIWPHLARWLWCVFRWDVVRHGVVRMGEWVVCCCKRAAAVLIYLFVSSPHSRPRSCKRKVVQGSASFSLVMTRTHTWLWACGCHFKSTRFSWTT